MTINPYETTTVDLNIGDPVLPKRSLILVVINVLAIVLQLIGYTINIVKVFEVNGGDITYYAALVAIGVLGFVTFSMPYYFGLRASYTPNASQLLRPLKVNATYFMLATLVGAYLLLKFDKVDFIFLVTTLCLLLPIFLNVVFALKSR